MGLIDRVKHNIRDVATFGPAALARHPARLMRRRHFQVNVAGAGSIFLRPGESDIAVLRQVFGGGNYAGLREHSILRRVRAHYDSILRDGRTPAIIDAGANIGLTARFFASTFDKAHVVAIEPEPGNAAMLRLNAEAETRIHVVEAAIGSESGFVAVTNTGMGWAAKTERVEKGVPIVTIADAKADVPNGMLFIVKVDIEGFESDLFANNTGWLDEARMVVIEPHDWLFPGKRTSRSLQKAMAERDFDIPIAGEDLVYLKP